MTFQSSDYHILSTEHHPTRVVRVHAPQRVPLQCVSPQRLSHRACEAGQVAGERAKAAEAQRRLDAARVANLWKRRGGYRRAVQIPYVNAWRRGDTTQTDQIHGEAVHT